MSDRHAFRANWHDYNGGIYFVTICTHDKLNLFGRISDGEMHYSAVGQIVADCLMDIPKHHSDVELLNHVVMPNHIHMVINVGARYIAPASESPVNTGCLKPPRHGEPHADNHFNSRLAVIVGTFKAACTRVGARYIAPTITRTTRKHKLWQRSFHEHIIRDQRAFDNIMNYIDTNVERWDSDCFNKVNNNGKAENAEP